MRDEKKLREHRGDASAAGFYLPPKGRYEGDGNQRLGLMSTF